MPKESKLFQLWPLSGMQSHLPICNIQIPIEFALLMVPGGGIEPPTRGFSVHCSTTELPRRQRTPLRQVPCAVHRLPKFSSACLHPVPVLPVLQERSVLKSNIFRKANGRDQRWHNAWNRTASSAPTVDFHRLGNSFEVHSIKWAELPAPVKFKMTEPGPANQGC